MKQLTPRIGLINNRLRVRHSSLDSRKASSMQSAGNIMMYIACAFPLIGMLWSFKDTVPFGA
jgi:hypothetical protein